MDLSQIVVATIALARNEAEEAELEESLIVLASLKLPVVVADGGSTSSFQSFLHTLSNFTVLPNVTGGVWPQAKASVQAAAQTAKPFIFYTEPDKKDFFKSGLPRMLAAMKAAETTGVLLASRSATGFGSFPPFQQMTETTVNNCCAEITGVKTDYCYGPFVINKNLVPHLNAIKEDVGWGWRPFMFGTAKRLGYTVGCYEKDFFCPLHQRSNDGKERIYRMKQLEQNIRGLVLSTTVVL